MTDDQDEAVNNIIRKRPDTWMFAWSNGMEMSDRTESGSTIHTDGQVPTDQVISSIGSLVLKLADDSGTHPAIILMRLNTMVGNNLDSPAVSIDPTDLE